MRPRFLILPAATDLVLTEVDCPFTIRPGVVGGVVARRAARALSDCAADGFSWSNAGELPFRFTVNLKRPEPPDMRFQDVSALKSLLSLAESPLLVLVLPSLLLLLFSVVAPGKP